MNERGDLDNDYNKTGVKSISNSGRIEFAAPFVLNIEATETIEPYEKNSIERIKRKIFFS